MKPIRINYRDLAGARNLDPAQVASRTGAWQELWGRFGTAIKTIDGPDSGSRR
jgi:hypothetical protein